MQKRMSELTPEEQQARREYNRETKRRSREKQKAAPILSHDEEFDQFPEEQRRLLSGHVKEVLAKVKSELGLENFGDYQSDQDAEHAVDAVARTLLAHKKDWVREVHSPSGLFYGGTYFADSLGDVIVWTTHRYDLEQSQTFSMLYRELLLHLDQRYGANQNQHSRAIKAELSGAYVAARIREARRC